MQKTAVFFLLTLALSAVAEECKLREPIDIGTNDPRVSLVWDKRITLVDVELDYKPDFRDYSAHNPPGTDVIAVELYRPEGICGGAALAGAIGLTNDCSKGVAQGAWNPDYCLMDFLEYGRVGFSHVYDVPGATCKLENENHNGLRSYSTDFDATTYRDGIRATVKDKKLLSLEIETDGKTYCVKAGRRVQPKYYKDR
ncbi:MAG: hypothetical protein R3B54_07365 [Bdellovibrionota bacterium]